MSDPQLRELLPFLRDKNLQVRQIAIENLIPYTQKDSPHRNIFLEGIQGSGGGLQPNTENSIMRDLKLLCRDQLAVAHDAFRALVNLSDSALLTKTLSEPTFLDFVVAYIINPQSICADLAAMLLSNITASAVACSALLSLKVSVIISKAAPNGYYPTHSRSGSSLTPVPYPEGDERNVLALPLLVDAFVQGAELPEGGDPSRRTRKAHLHFLSNVFANLTASPTGRAFFLTPLSSEVSVDQQIEYPLAKIVPFTNHSDQMRRGGVASTIKNCCFNVVGHQAMLTPEGTKVAVEGAKPTSGVDVLPYILFPLAGPEELEPDDQDKLLEPLQFLPPDKKREPDATIRLTHVESLLLLCHTRWGRDYQRSHGVYEIIRATHLAETVDKISEHIERLVLLLKGDEPKNNLDGDKINPQIQAVDSDDEDNQIQEV